MDKPAVDTELLVRWLAALRSGKYSQTTDALRDERGFCCLGVLCDVYDPSEWREMPKDADVDEFPTAGKVFMGEVGLLPGVLVDMLGMREGDGSGIRVTDKGQEYKNEFVSLVEANDDGVDFCTIADSIERHYKERGVL